MKNIFKLVPVVLLVGYTSCTKKLDKEPLGLLVDATFYKTNDDMIRATNAAYDPLSWESAGNTNIVFFNFFFGDIASDDAIAGGNMSEARVIPYDNFSVNSQDQGLAEVWKKCYIGIYRTNLVIEKAPLSNASAEIKNRVTGEAKFLRAYYYFQLTRMFGGVPLVTSILSADEYNKPKSPTSVVYAQIETDLKEAAALLPAVQAEKGRATKGSAQGLLTRVYLFQSKWSDLLPVAKDIIASGTYDLLPNYATVHSEENENSIESLFEIQATDAVATGDERQNEGTFMNKFIAPRDQLVGGFGVNVPSIELVNEFKADSALWGKMDPRKKATIISDGDSVIFGNDTTIITTTIAGAPRVVGVNYYTRKYVVSSITGSQTNGRSNQRIIRFSDVLLMAAEAAFNLGQESDARDYVNRVRKRVNMPELDATYAGTKLRDAIWKERRLELAMEGLRFFDIVRQGRAAQLIQATNEGKGFVQGRNEVFPIPQPEIDVSNGVLVQNPNY